MKRNAIATVGVIVWALLIAGPVRAVPVPFSDGSIFLETFAGNAFDEAGSSFVGPDISFSGSNSAHITNGNPADEGSYNATGFSGGASSEYVSEIVFSHNAPMDDLNGDGTGITRGMLYRAFNAST